jgi:hypothetical protein
VKMIWTGTDSLYLVRFPKQLKWTKIFYVLVLRIYAKISDFLVQNHYSCGSLVAANLTKFGMKKAILPFRDMLLYPDKIKKKKHKGFNVLYYYPQKNTKFNRWLYGLDLFYQLKEQLPDLNYIVVDGTKDMRRIYPITDFMIRPNRHDGHPRMVDECILNGIPYYWSEMGEPSVEEMKQLINEYRIQQ